MKKAFLIILSILLGFSAMSCFNTLPEEKDNSDPTLAENYDFGDPISWAGDKIKVQDLGDAILEDYPYDNHYDWGQSIIYDEDDQIYKMWWCRQSPHDTIWYAESNDLKIWKNAKKLLKVDQDSTWIKMHLGKPTVLKIDGKYIMYFEAPATLEGYVETDNNVLRATSTDGIKWDFYTAGTSEAYPVIRMTDEQMNNGYYGIGQPSALYVNGTYYLYCTYSVGGGDKMYRYTSTDGIHFDEGIQVFDRAACGVKYNNKTNKFMMAYEKTSGGISNIYYMDSDDGINFTYKSLAEASSNPNLLSKNVKLVRGYPDFVGNGHGIVNDYTIYCAYMEGKIADAGDWRMYSNTWDIHICAFNLKQFANRTMVLPDGHVYTKDTIKKYAQEHITYEMPRWYKINRTSAAPVIDANYDDLWDNSEVMNLDRTAFTYGYVPTASQVKLRMLYDQANLYFFAEIKDPEITEEDYLFLVIDEKKLGGEKSDKTSFIKVYFNGRTSYYDGQDVDFDRLNIAIRSQEQGFNVEIKMPWRYPESITQNKDIGFDAFYYDKVGSYTAVKCWNDYNVQSIINLDRLGDAEPR